MKKLEGRALICLSIVLFLALGTSVFIYRYVKYGPQWATFYANQHIYKNGHIAMGKIFDVNGNLLLDNSGEALKFNDNQSVRMATLHVVGDGKGRIATSAENAFQSKMIGYNLVTGVYNLNGRGDDLTLTIDKDVSVAAYNAMGQYNGTVGVYNYETGEILCMVSKPTFDPANPIDTSKAPSGTFLNKFISGRLSPGSVMKTVTAAAAVETIPDITSNFTFNCKGYTIVGGERLDCAGVHGHEDIYSAMANSCNGAFGEITREVGAKTMREYVDKLGLTSSYDIDGIKSTKSSFNFPDNSPLNLSWAGIGQYEDEINPLSMMVYMGAIANGGKGAIPKVIHRSLSGADFTDKMIEANTADELQKMMKAVVHNIRYTNFSGLDVYAKTGTAQLDKGNPNGWFVGFIKDKDYPYAFVVVIEKKPVYDNVNIRVADAVIKAIKNR